MKMTRPLLIATSMLALAACAKKAPPELPPAPVQAEEPAYTPPPSGPAKGSHEDFMANVASDRVFFDTDKYDIDAQDQATLQSQAQWLQANPNVRATIEGHADERGTRDYNLALGERRASAVRDYLVSLGIATDRMLPVSRGEESPQCTEEVESCYMRNRRGHFLFTAK